MANGLDAKAAEHLSVGLKENKALQTLKYAITCPVPTVRTR